MDYTQIAIAIIAATAGTGLTLWFGRRKSSAETQNIVVSGEIMIGKEWAEYAQQQKKDKEELRADFTRQINDLRTAHDEWVKSMEEKYKALEDKYNKLVEENSTLKEEKDGREKRIKILEDQVEEFKKQLAGYQTDKDTKDAIIDSAKEEIHTKVDEKLEDIKQH